MKIEIIWFIFIALLGKGSEEATTSIQTLWADDPWNPDLDSRQEWSPNELESSQSIYHYLTRQIQHFFSGFPDCSPIGWRLMYQPDCPGNPSCLYRNLDQVPIRQNRITMNLCLDYKALDRKVLDHIRRNFKFCYNLGILGPSMGRIVHKITYEAWIFSRRASRLICFRVKTKE